jgi:DNA-binding transcriptional MocR family regulator
VLADAGLAEWDEPQAALFLWLKLNKVKDTKAVMEKAIKNGVSSSDAEFESLLVKVTLTHFKFGLDMTLQVVTVYGSAFLIDNSQPSPYLRLSYSIATREQIDQVGCCAVVTYCC